MAELKLDLAVDARQAIRGVDDFGDALDKVTTDLEQVAKESGRTESDLVTDFRKIATEAKKADTQVDKMGGKGGAFHSAGKASGEFKDEALANFSEVTSSFDGSMESITEGIQGTLGGVAGSIPLIGIAAGVAAAGIGAISTEFQKQADRVKEIKDGIVQDFLELGDALDKAAVDRRVTDILADPAHIKEAQLLADLLDVTVGQAALAMAGDYESAGVTIDEVMKGINNASSSVDINTWTDLKTTIDGTTTAMTAGKEAADAQADAQKRTAQTTKEEQQKQRDAITQTTDLLTGVSKQQWETRLKVTLDTSEYDNWRPSPKDVKLWALTDKGRIPL